MTMNNLVLFDMDGTLTPSRKKATQDIVNALNELRRFSDVGILTGSGLNYLLEQCKNIMIQNLPLEFGKIWIMPCNGTQLYDFCEETHYLSCLSKNSMSNELGEREVSRLKSYLFSIQSEIMKDIADLPYTDNFIDDRESMINWCPIGRSAGDKERRAFIDFDRKFDFRELTIRKIKGQIKDLDLGVNLVVKLGGDTSVDIFPEGWDKTYGLRHFEGKRTWFVGDRCFGQGNDREIYEELLQHSRAFSTTGVDETIEIINNNIIPVIVKESFMT